MCSYDHATYFCLKSQDFVFCRFGGRHNSIIQWSRMKPRLLKRSEKLVFEKNAVIARPVRRLVVAIPRIEGKCTEKHPEEWES